MSIAEKQLSANGATSRKEAPARLLKVAQLALLLVITVPASSHAQETRFFRVVGPVTTTITAFGADGYITWTNAPTNATFTVQMAISSDGGSNWLDFIQVPAANPATTERLFDPNPPAGMVLIPAGSFTMGDNLDGGSTTDPLHSVYVSAFYVDRTDVTLALWEQVYNWATNNGYTFDYGATGKAADHPARSMTWYDAVKWCNARSEKEGATPAYYTTAARSAIYRTGDLDLTNSCVNWSAGYRLPTEAEWEKAARGGASGQRFPWGNTISWSQANYFAFPLSGGGYAYDVNQTTGFHPTFNDGVYPYTSPVGYFPPNRYGLYDMAGNVWQWCWDWFGDYSAGAQTDPRGAASGSNRVDRGGAWGGTANVARTADRDHSYPTRRNGYIGFRSVLPAGL